MLTGSDIPELVDCVDANSIRVNAPTSILFLCGGPIDVKVDPAPSLRDAFARKQDKDPFKKYRFLVAEELNAFFPKGTYTDILSFENDIAQISDLILLFSESYGSAAELGAFAMVEEISRRMLVVLDDKNYKIDSFITLGPIRLLTNVYGEQALCILNLADLKLENIRNVSSLDVLAFTEVMQIAIKTRIGSYHEHSTFDPDRSGHIIKLSVGLLQHYGALTLDEIWLHLDAFGVLRTKAQITNLLLCAEFADWVVRDKRGLTTYFVAKAEKDALHYAFRADVDKMDRLRWRMDIRQHWKVSEPDRFKSITSIVGAD